MAGNADHLGKMGNRYAAIVDGYSAASQLAPELGRRGIPCVHIQSSAKIPAILARSFNKHDFVDNIIMKDTPEGVISELNRYPLACVIAGAECGVELADKLSARMNLPSNGTMMSLARRNKYAMHGTLADNGIRSIPQIKSNDISKILSWVHAHNFEAVVVKPLCSGGTDHVFACFSDNEIALAVESILGSNDILGNKNEEVLVQERINGTEYAVNTVSCNGVHYNTSIWRYHKKLLSNGSKVYDWDELLQGDGDIELALMNYACGVLNALQIKYGSSHVEIMIDNDGPVLIELGARIDGMEDLEFNRKCTGSSQIDRMLDSYLYPETMARFPKTYSLKKNARTVSLISRQEGMIKALARLDEIYRLPSFFKMNLRTKIGSQLCRTTDLFSSPALVFLLHDDGDVIEDDYRAIRKLEDEGLFEVA